MIIKRSKTYLKTKPKNAQLDSKFNEIKKNYERKSRGGKRKAHFSTVQQAGNQRAKLIQTVRTNSKIVYI